MMVVARENVHLFLFSPQTGANCYGLTLRLRRSEGHDNWTHWTVKALQRGYKGRPGKSVKRGGQQFMVRRSLIVFEICRWETTRGTSERRNLKAYVRLKASPGGRQV